MWAAITRVGSDRRGLPRGHTKDIDVVQFVAAAGTTANTTSKIIKFVLLFKLVLLRNATQTVAEFLTFLNEGRQVQQQACATCRRNQTDEEAATSETEEA